MRKSVSSPAATGQISVETHGAVLVARLDGGPHALFDAAMAEQLQALVDRADRDPAIGAVVFTGTHPDRFLSHSDVRWLQEGGTGFPPINTTLGQALGALGQADQPPARHQNARADDPPEIAAAARQLPCHVPQDERERHHLHRGDQRLGPGRWRRTGVRLRCPPHGRWRPCHRPDGSPARVDAWRRRLAAAAPTDRHTGGPARRPGRPAIHPQGGAGARRDR